MKSQDHIPSLLIRVTICALFMLNTARALDTKDVHAMLLPSTGMWWNPDAPGTGAAMEFRQSGEWFVALYTYTREGDPVFYTLHGPSLEYSVDRTAFGDEVGNHRNRGYARATSKVYAHENGRCLGCNRPQLPNSEPLPGVTAEILFFDLEDARIRFTGAIQFEERLSPFAIGRFVFTLGLTATHLRSITFFNGSPEGDTQIVSAHAYEAGICSVGSCGMFYPCFEPDDCVVSSQHVQDLVESLSHGWQTPNGYSPLYLNLDEGRITYNTFRSHLRSEIIGVLGDGSDDTSVAPTLILIQSITH